MGGKAAGGDTAYNKAINRTRFDAVFHLLWFVLAGYRGRSVLSLISEDKVVNRIILRCFMLILLVSALTNQIVRSQEQKPDQSTKCPMITVDCPTGSQGKGETLAYKVTVSDIPAGRELSYRWEVSKGKIIEGQGTTSIKVDLGGEDNQGITATVEVGGLDNECTKSASCTSQIGMRRKAGLWQSRGRTEQKIEADRH